MSDDFTGISFPFRLGNKGGIVLSTTSRYDVSHVEESLIQVLGTMKGERVMEYALGSDLDTQIFEPNDISTHSLIKYQVVEAIESQEPRVEVTLDDITLEQEGSKLIAFIKYKLLKYNSDHTLIVDLGGV